MDKSATLLDSFRTQLIELIEMEPSIWDHKSDEYHLQGRKEAAWTRVLHAMKRAGHDCTMGEVRSVWRNLRDTRKRKRRCHTGSPGEPTWKYDSMMAFLNETEFDGTTTSNLDDNGNFLTMNENDDTLQTMEPEERPRRKKEKKKDAALKLIKEATDAVKSSIKIADGTALEGKEEQKDAAQRAPRVQALGFHDGDSYSHFGAVVAHELQKLDSPTARHKMYMISSVLLMNASVVINLDDMHTTDRSTTE